MYLIYFVLVLFCVCLVNTMCKEDKQKCGIEVTSNPVHHNPWVAFLLYYSERSLLSLRCAGTLVSDRRVVTAAHCVLGPHFNRMKVLLGEYDVESRIDCDEGICSDPPVYMTVKKVTVHPKYLVFANDIAVLELHTAVTFTDYIRPICLPSKYDFPENLTFTAAGWGEVSLGKYSRYKKHIPLQYQNTSVCRTVYPHTKLPKNFICAGGEKGLDTCVGDSGGPLMLKMADRVELWGITNAGHVTCGMKGFPGVYTRVYDYLEWLERVMV